MTEYGIEWERELAELWSAFDDLSEQEFLLRMTRLTDQLPDESPVRPFELAAALDSTGHPEGAVPLYELAIASGVGLIRRRRAVIQLASSLRLLGRAEESVELLTAERAQLPGVDGDNFTDDRYFDDGSDDERVHGGSLGNDELSDELCTVLALALVDVGREREAVSVAVTALVPHLTRYRRSMANYARQLLDD